MASQEVTNNPSVQDNYNLDWHGHWPELRGFLTDPTTHLQSVTNTGGTDYMPLMPCNRTSIHVVNGASNTCTFTVEGSNDGTNFTTVAYGQGSNTAYTQNALSVTGGSKALLFLPQDDAYRYLRVNVSAANSNGTTFRVFGRS